MFLSIGLTTYNRQKLSRFCIEAIRDRTPRDEYEFIVIDNGSVDGTVPMLEKFKDEGVIDKLVVNHPNSLGKAINDAWKLSDLKAKWLLVLSNDVFCMEGWLENLKLVVQSSLKPDYVICDLRMAAFQRKVSHKTSKGGSYVVDSVDWEMGYPFGGGLAVKRSLVFKHKIQFSEERTTWLRRSIYSDIFRRLHELHLKWIELGKPCILSQDCEFTNPEYASYYASRFEKCHNKKRFARLKRQGYTTDPDAYYEGSGYEISKFYRDALEKLKKKE